MADLTLEPGSSALPPGAAEDILDTRAAGGKLVRGAGLRFGSYVGLVALSVLSAALLTRHLGTSRFGQYTTIMSLTGVVANVTDAGMSNLGTREYAVLEGAARERLMRDLLGLRVALTLIGVVLAAAFAVAAQYDAALLAGTIVAGLSTVAIVFQHTLSIPLSTQLRLGTLSLLDLARQAMAVLAIVLLVLAGAGVLPLLAVPLAANLLLIPPTWALVRGRISARAQIRPRAWVGLLKPTLAFSLASAVATIYAYTAQIITSVATSAHQSGLFAISFRVFLVVGGVPALLVAATLPLLARAARDDRERLAYALQRIFEVSLVAGLAAAIGLLAGARFVIDVVGGHGYRGAVGVLQIQAAALLASFVLAGWAYGVLSLRRHQRLLLASTAAFGVSCVLTVVLASVDGARGAAIATVAGETTLAIATLLSLVRGSPYLRPQLGRAWRAIAAAAPAIGVGLIPGLPSVVAGVLALVVFGALVLALRALPDEVFEVLPPWLRFSRR
jgi:O-antigen/teichoic acid export membrane protein